MLVSLSLNFIFIYRWKCVRKLNHDFQDSEKALKKSEHRYRTLVESLIEGIGIVDENEVFTFANKAGNEIFGCEGNELVGKGLNEFTSSEDFNFILNKTAIRKKGTTEVYELDIIRCDKQIRTILVKSSPVIDENGEYKGAFGLFTDITEQKQIAEKKEELIKELEIKLADGDKIACGFIPICASCHQIRDEEENWHPVTDYLSQHTNIKFSHSICPKCKIEIYGPDKN